MENPEMFFPTTDRVHPVWCWSPFPRTAAADFAAANSRSAIKPGRMTVVVSYRNRPRRWWGRAGHRAVQPALALDYSQLLIEGSWTR